MEYRRYIIYLAARSKDGRGELNEFVIRKLTLVREHSISRPSTKAVMQKKKVEETNFYVDTENGAFSTSSQMTGLSSFNEFLLRTEAPPLP